MRLLFLALLTLVAAVLLARLAGEYSGFVAIGLGEWVVQTTPVAFVLALAVAGVVFYAVLRGLSGLWRLPRRVSRWSRQRRQLRGMQRLTGGLRALAEGHYQRAERLLLKDVDDSPEPLLHYLGAVEAARHQGAVDRETHYLQLAESVRDAGLAVGLRRAEILLEAERPAEARRALAKLSDSAPRHPRVLQLMLQAQMEDGDVDAALRLLPQLRRSGALDSEALAALEQTLYSRLLDAAPRTPTAVHEAWKRLPRAAHRQPGLLARHARNLAEADLGGEAEKLLRQAIKRQWDPALVRLYGRVDGGDGRAQLDRAESWVREHGDDPALRYALGELCQRNELWGQAREHLEAALAATPCAEGYQRLAEVLSRMGESEAAARSTREGLKLASGPQSAMLALLPAGTAEG